MNKILTLTGDRYLMTKDNGNWTFTEIPAEVVIPLGDALPEKKYAGVSSFSYDNSLDRKYDSKKKVVTSVTFNMGRYGRCNDTVKFSAPVTEKDAIKKVEEYLSKELDEDYFTLLKSKGDLFAGREISFDQFKENENEFDGKFYKACRGDCLGNCKFLEVSKVTKGNLVLECGS